MILRLATLPDMMVYFHFESVACLECFDLKAVGDLRSRPFGTTKVNIYPFTAGVKGYKRKLYTVEMMAPRPLVG